MKIQDLTENDCVLISTKEEAEAIAKLLNKAGIVKPMSKENFRADWMDIGNWLYLHIMNGKHADLYRYSKEWKVIPASKFLKPSLKKRVKELEKWRKQLEQPKTATDIEVHFDEVEKLPEKWCVKRNADNAETINKWAGVQWGAEYYFDEYGYIHNDSNIYDAVCHGYTEISFETFKRLVLKEDEKPVEKEFGKWYKDEHSKALLCYTACNGLSDLGYGFDVEGEWMEEGEVDLTGLVPATDEEVKEALIKEAESRGFKDGVVFYGLIRTKDKINKTGNISFEFCAKTNELRMFSNKFETLNDNYVINHRGYSSIFINGKWAEIISEPEAIDFSKAGQLVKSDDVIVFTTGEHNGSMFSGYALTTFERGQFENDWDKELFTLCTEPVTLSN